MRIVDGGTPLPDLEPRSTMTTTGVSAAPTSYSAGVSAGPSPETRTDARTARVSAVDIVRGLAVVLMAIDHVRVYSGIPAGGPQPDVFFTRWITHFVAPIFVLLAGTAAWLHGRKLGDPGALSAWLVKRGLVLVLLELTVIRFFWTFNTDFAGAAMGGVIWMIGWCMVLLGALSRLPMRAVAAIGAVLVAGHNALTFLPRPTVDAITGSALGPLWRILYFGGVFELGETPVFILYSLVPWVGIMALGWALGPVATWPAERRRAFCLKLGLAMVVAFVALRALDVYGDPSHWRERPPQMPAALAFLATAKYPASLLFLLMTLGPATMLLGVAERLPARVSGVLETFGRVPFFYYILHIPLIHLLAIGVGLARTGRVEPWLLMNQPAMVPPAPEGWRWPMWLLYLVTTIAVTLLYFACRWYAGYKARHRHPVLSYL